VAFGLDENLSAVAGTGNLSAVAFDLIQWAQAQGPVADLVVAAVKEAPRNAKLAAFTRECGIAVPAAPASPAPAKSPSYPGKVKLDVTWRLVSDWPNLADFFDIPPAGRARFERGACRASSLTGSARGGASRGAPATCASTHCSKAGFDALCVSNSARPCGVGCGNGRRRPLTRSYHRHGNRRVYPPGARSPAIAGRLQPVVGGRPYARSSAARSVSSSEMAGPLEKSPESLVVLLDDALLLIGELPAGAGQTKRALRTTLSAG
jgi:hypothetical protein